MKTRGNWSSRKLAIGAPLLLSMALAYAPANAQEKLTVWWNKGYYKAEDQALFEVVRKFEAKTGVKVELSQYTTQDMIPKTVAALDANSPPDIAYSDAYHFQSLGKWAFEGRLANLDDLIAPIEKEYAADPLKTVVLYNDKTKTRAYYAFPVKQATLHIHYWKDLLEQAGYKEDDIPKDWKGFWSFWCDKAQTGLRKASGKRLFGIGHPMGVDATDSFISFLVFMDAYNVSVVDKDGKLTVDDPTVKAGLVAAMKDYADVYTRGCTPPSSTSWKDPDNNVAFHNKTTIMTHNSTISVPGKWLDDANNPSLSEQQRADAKTNYYDNIRTVVWPNSPEGKPIHTRASVTVGVVFEQAKNKARAKEFAAFLLQDENLTPYVEGALGRWFPVKAAAQKRPFWDEDVHRRAERDQFANGVGGYEMARNYKFTIVNSENVWAKAMSRILVDKLSAEQAVDEMIARIKEIAG